jgi:hypothetical protein
MLRLGYQHCLSSNSQDSPSKILEIWFKRQKVGIYWYILAMEYPTCPSIHIILHTDYFPTQKDVFHRHVWLPDGIVSSCNGYAQPNFPTAYKHPWVVNARSLVCRHGTSTKRLQTEQVLSSQGLFHTYYDKWICLTTGYPIFFHCLTSMFPYLPR